MPTFSIPPRPTHLLITAITSHESNLKRPEQRLGRHAPFHDSLKLSRGSSRINDHRNHSRCDELRSQPLEFVPTGFLASRDAHWTLLSQSKQIEIKERLFPMDGRKGALCGRLAVPANCGNSMATPCVCRRGREKLSPAIDRASYALADIAALPRILAGLKASTSFFEIFDSHVAGAARKMKESDRGS